MQQLRGKVAVVTGASRGGGRGIALVLGEEGAIVYVTGRSVRGEPTTDNRPGTIDGTAEEVTARGGMGISVRCDHTVNAEVEAVFERVQRERGRLDILVNNVWGGYEGTEHAPLNAPFWEQPLWRWDKMFMAGVRAHYMASHMAVSLMMSQRQGLVVNTTFWDRGKYLIPLPYDLAKCAVNRMAYGMALELREYNIAVVALSPGWMRTEVTLRRFNTDEENWHTIPELSSSESTQYIGRAVAALATDPDVMRRSGHVMRVGDLAREYGFTDIDGRQVPSFRIPEEYVKD